MILYQAINSSVSYNFNTREYEDCNFVLHLHRDFELIYVKEGNATVSIEGEDISVSEGGFALVLQNEVHSFSCDSDTRIWIGVFSEEYVREFSDDIKGRKIISHVFYPTEEDRNFLLRHLIFGFPDKHILTAALTVACALFYDACTGTFCGDEKINRPKTHIHKILAYISEHYTENIHLSDLAAALGYEEHYLSRLFNSIFKKNFTLFVNEYRVLHSRKLMKQHKDMTIADIAFASGFGSVRNFNRAYRMVTGRSPCDDRADGSKNDIDKLT